MANCEARYARHTGYRSADIVSRGSVSSSTTATSEIDMLAGNNTGNSGAMNGSFVTIHAFGGTLGVVFGTGLGTLPGITATGTTVGANAAAAFVAPGSPLRIWVDRNNHLVRLVSMDSSTVQYSISRSG